MENKNKIFTKKGAVSDILIFLFGPLVFLFVVGFTGNQIFYNGNKNEKNRKRMVILLSSGAAFYLMVIVILALTIDY